MCGVRVPTHEALVRTRLAAAVRVDTKSGSVFATRGLFCMSLTRVVALVTVGRNPHLPLMTISAPQAFQVLQPQWPLLEGNPEIRQQLARLLVPVVFVTSLLILHCSLTLLLFLLLLLLLPTLSFHRKTSESGALTYAVCLCRVLTADAKFLAKAKLS